MLQLKNIVFPDTLTSIGRYSISNCTSMKQVIIGSSVVNIAEVAFLSSSNINTVYFKTPILPTFGDKSFDDISPTSTAYTLAGTDITSIQGKFANYQTFSLIL